MREKLGLDRLEGEVFKKYIRALEEHCKVGTQEKKEEEYLETFNDSMDKLVKAYEQRYGFEFHPHLKSYQNNKHTYVLNPMAFFAIDKMINLAKASGTDNSIRGHIIMNIAANYNFFGTALLGNNDRESLLKMIELYDIESAVPGVRAYKTALNRRIEPRNTPQIMNALKDIYGKPKSSSPNGPSP